MPKITPNPPETDDVSPYESTDPKKLNEAADRALDYYLKPVMSQDLPPAHSTSSPPTQTTKPCWSTRAKPWHPPV